MHSSRRLSARLNFDVSHSMNAAIELHDSNVKVTECSNGDFRIEFSGAYVHRSEGVPGVDPGTGHIQPAEIVFSSATWNGLSPECVGDISDGWVSVNGEVSTLIPLPSRNFGLVSAEFAFTSG